MPGNLNARVSWFLLLLVATSLALRSPLAALIRLSLNDERYSYVALIPVMTLSLVLFGRKTIFLSPRYCPAIGVPIMFLGAGLAGLAPMSRHLSVVILELVLIWIGAFILIFGRRAFMAAGFPIGFLFLMIPLPATALNHLVSFLQYSSAYMSEALFKALTIPAMRQGLTISLPGIDIQVAQQCSGIRSSIALVLASSLAGYVILHSNLNRFFLILITIPVVIVKNAVRIVTLSGLALYVDKGFLFGSLHHFGGLCFSLLDLAIVVPLLLHLQKSEARRRTQRIPA
jgi:exosortase